MNLLLLSGLALALLLLGTLIGRYYAPDRRPLRRAAEAGVAYARGLVEVLDGHPQVAIQHLVTSLKHDTDTLEAYFALGALFRERGEHERAVRVHQSLLLRRAIDPSLRLRVHRQLAEDFAAAGFRRRAIRALEYVVTHDRRNAEALERLATLYEQMENWSRAAAAQRRLARIARRDTSALRAHLLSQEAAAALKAGALPSARKALRRALSAKSHSVHALDILGQYHMAHRKPRAAAKAWREALHLRPDLVDIFLPRLTELDPTGTQSEEIENMLRALQENHPQLVCLRLSAVSLRAERDPAGALSELMALSASSPLDVAVQHKAASLALAEGSGSEVRASVAALLGALQASEMAYCCSACAQRSAVFRWRCDQCGKWESFARTEGQRK